VFEKSIESVDTVAEPFGNRHKAYLRFSVCPPSLLSSTQPFSLLLRIMSEQTIPTFKLVLGASLSPFAALFFQQLTRYFPSFLDRYLIQPIVLHGSSQLTALSQLLSYTVLGYSWRWRHWKNNLRQGASIRSSFVFERSRADLSNRPAPFDW